MYLNFSFSTAVFNVFAVILDYPIDPGALRHVSDVNVRAFGVIMNCAKLEKKVDVGSIVLFFVRVEAFSCFCSEIAFFNHLFQKWALLKEYSIFGFDVSQL